MYRSTSASSTTDLCLCNSLCINSAIDSSVYAALMIWLMYPIKSHKNWINNSNERYSSVYNKFFREGLPGKLVPCSKSPSSPAINSKELFIVSKELYCTEPFYLPLFSKKHYFFLSNFIFKNFQESSHFSFFYWWYYHFLLC